MRYKDIACSVCGEKFTENSDVVVCPVCGAPCHRECWDKTGKCVYEEQHASGYRWEFPKTEQPKEEKVREPEKRFDEVFKNGEGVVICPHCQAPNYGNDMYCRNCHAPLKDIRPDGNSANGFENDGNGRQAFDENGNAPYGDGFSGFDGNAEAMYNSYNLYGGLDPDSSLDGIPVREYAAFVGGRTPGRIIRKVATLERYGRTVAPSIACIFGPIWFLRRKMIKIGVTLSVIVTALCLAAGLLQITDAYREMVTASVELTAKVASGEMNVADMREQLYDIQSAYLEAGRTPAESAREKASEILYVIAFYCVPVGSFIGGISLYRADVRKKIMRIRGECSDMNTYMNELRRRGGSSAGLTLVGVLVYGIAMFLYSYLPMLAVLL